MANVLADRTLMEHTSPRVKPFGSSLLARKLLEAQAAQEIAQRNVPRDIRFGEQALQGGVPTEQVTGLELSPLDLIGTGIGTKAATVLGKFAAPLAAALGATAVGSRLNRGTRLGELAAMYPRQQGIFAGPTAKTADLAALSRAEEMKAAGIPDEQIWKETGWTFGFPDQKPRFEISDAPAQFKKGGVEEMYFYGYRPQEQIYEHPELYAAYPESGKILTTYTSGDIADVAGAYGAHYSPQENTISLGIPRKGADLERASNINLHELQHAIQEREGFARGGSPEMFTKNTMAGLHSYEDMLGAEKILQRAKQYGITVNDFMKNPPRWVTEKQLSIAKNFESRPESDFKYAKEYVLGAESPMEAYHALAGEAEARLTQKRMRLTPAERLAQYPVSQFDVPVEEQIVRYGKGKAASVPEYGMTHRPPMRGEGAPLYDVTGGGDFYPEDVYSNNGLHYYGSGQDKADMESWNVIRQMRGKPNAMVTMYRAVPLSNAEQAANLDKQLAAYMKRGKLPPDADNFSNGSKWYEWASNESDRLKSIPEMSLDFNAGDWVTLSKTYAKEHGESNLRGGYKILSKKVPAKHLYTNADSFNEFGYDPLE